MPKYSIYVFCDDCSNEHDTGITVHLSDGPTQRVSFGDIYDGKPLPAPVLRIADERVQCPRTGKFFVQKDRNLVFLVPIEDDS